MWKPGQAKAAREGCNPDREEVIVTPI